MKYYVNVLITGSDYCTLNLQKPLVDDYIIRRMIKCSSNLGCYMQATVLCQVILDDFRWVSNKVVYKKGGGGLGLKLNLMPPNF